MKVAAILGLLLVPLTLCKVIPSSAPVLNSDANSTYYSQTDSQLFTINDVALFLRKVRTIANEVFPTYETTKDYWPSNFDELVELADTQITKNYGDITMISSNPLQDVINGIFGTVNQVTGGINNVTGLVPKNITLSPGIVIVNPNSTIASDIIVDIKNNADKLISTVTKGNVTSLNSVVSSITQKAGSFVDELTGGVISSKAVNQSVTLLGNSIMDVAAGKKDIVDVLTDFLNLSSSVIGANNPLGKFIQNVAVYLSNNPDGVLANFIKIATFINALIMTLTKIAESLVSGLLQLIVNLIGYILQSLLNLFLGGIFGTHRLQEMTAEEVLPLQDLLDSMMRAQSGTTQKSTYIQIIVDILSKVIQKLFAMDPFVLSVLTDPSEVNIRRLILEIAKVLTDSNK
jgi:hypothetical protein